MQPLDTHLYKTITIKEIQEAVKGFKTFTFEANPSISYKAGQYLTLVDYVNNEEVRRSYSITSSPFLNEPLTIGVKRVENGLFSRKLIDNAKPGDTWLTTGAGGFFVLPEDTSFIKQLFFFAAGSGITPIYSLIKTAVHQSPHLQLVLVYSNASPEKAIFRHELELLAQQFPKQIQVEFLYSNSPDLNRARLHRDLFLHLLKKHRAMEAQETLYYICGPEAYMRMCTYLLQEEGISKEQIRRENFIIHTTPPVLTPPPDKKLHWVTIQAGAAKMGFPVQYPQTILSAAEAAGFSLPYSCRVGRCGNCAARCKEGTVWMSYNEVLSDREVNNGFILTCTAYPIHQDVVIEL